MTTTNDDLQNRPAPSPDQPVPDEFDLLCEHCGYSLVGLNRSNRCPECGEEFDPGALPLARIPWLFRRRLGLYSTARDTVREILFKPGGFAKELCRPVRVSAGDARQFRRIVLRIAMISCIFAAWMIAASVVQWAAIWSMRTTMTDDFIFGGIMCFVLIPLGIVLVGVFFRLMTDLPTFIWRGLDGDPIQLAPVHHYASAPLALTPLILIPLGIYLLLANWLIQPDDTWRVAAAWALLGACGGVLLLLWFIPLRFMRVATGCSWKRVIALAVYLPIHWLLMFAMCALAFSAATVGMHSLLREIL